MIVSIHNKIYSDYRYCDYPVASDLSVGKLMQQAYLTISVSVQSYMFMVHIMAI